MLNTSQSVPHSAFTGSAKLREHRFALRRPTKPSALIFAFPAFMTWLRRFANDFNGLPTLLHTLDAALREHQPAFKINTATRLAKYLTEAGVDADTARSARLAWQGFERFLSNPSENETSA